MRPINSAGLAVLAAVLALPATTTAAGSTTLVRPAALHSPPSSVRGSSMPPVSASPRATPLDSAAAAAAGARTVLSVRGLIGVGLPPRPARELPEAKPPR